MSAESASAATETERPARRAGLPQLFRRVAIGLYLVVLVYAIFIGFASVGPQVFSPVTAPRVEVTPAEPGEPGLSAIAAIEEDEGTCDQTLGHLHDALWEASGAAIADGRAPSDGFFRAWDDAQLHTTRQRCPNHPGYSDLMQLRYRLETTWRRFDREEGQLRARLDRLFIQP